MDKIRVHLLGRPYVEAGGERVNFPYKKAEGFFYYLCVKKTATREEIIYVLWGADNENVGREEFKRGCLSDKKTAGKGNSGDCGTYQYFFESGVYAGN